MLSQPSRWIFTRLLVFLPFLFAGLACAADSGDHPNSFPRVLSSASELDYPPFALVRDDGGADGFSVDLLKAVVSAVGLEITFKVGPWHAIKTGLANGELDVLPLVAHSAERDKAFDFTAPYLRMHGTIFVRRGENSIQDETDLKAKEVLVMRDDMTHEYALRRKLTDRLIPTDSIETAMRLLSDGKHDAVIAQQLVGLQLIKKLGLSNVVCVRSFNESSLKPATDPLSGFEQKICIAVKEGDKELLARLNEGLALVVTTGKYDELYDKWFGPILPQPAVSPARIAKYMFFILLPLLALIGISSAWYLKREVARKTHTIKQSEERLKRSQEIAHLGGWELDLQNNQLTWSDEVYRIFGLQPQQFDATYAAFLNSVHPDDRQKVDDAYAGSLRENRDSYEVEHRVVRPDGEVRHVLERCEHLRDHGGRIVRSVGMVRDITERHMADAALRESEAKYRNLFENMTEEVHFWQVVRDESGQIRTWRLVDVNPPTLKSWGKKTVDEIRGKTADEIFGPGATEHHLPVVHKIMTECVPHVYEDYIPHLDKYFRFAFVPLGNRFITTGADITDIKKIEGNLLRTTELLEKRSRELDAVLSSVQDYVYIFDPEGRFTFANKKLLDLWNMSAGQAVGKTMRDLNYPESVERLLLDGVRRVCQTGEVVINVTHYTSTTGLGGYFENVLSPILGPDGQVAFVAGSSRDISERRRAEEALRQSQATLQAFYDSSPLMMGMVELHGEKVIAVHGNTLVAAFFDTTPDRIPGRDFAELNPNHEINALWLDAYHQCQADHSTVRFEYQQPRFAGGAAWVSATVTPVPAGDSGYPRCGFVAEDITARKRATEAVAASERKYRELLETANSIILRCDHRGVIRFVNDFGLRFFGYSAKELIGRNVMLLVPKGEQSTGGDLDALDRDIVVHSERYTHNENITKDGRSVWVVWANKAILDGQGNVQEILAIGNDVTAMKATEQALRESERRLSLSVSATADAIWEWNLATQETYYSPRWYAMLGYENQVIPMNLEGWKKLCHPDDLQPTLDLIRSRLESSDDLSYSAEFRMRTKDGSWLWILGRGRVVERDEAGRPLLVSGTNTDITERKQAEIVQRNSEERLKASLAEKEVLLKEIHHRVKNNMQVISSLVDLQADAVEDAAMREVFQDVVYRVRSMAMVHEKLYQSSDLARVEFADYTETLLGYLWRAQGAAASGIRLDLDLAPVFLPIHLAVPCGLMLNELFSNTLKHAFSGRPSGQITVSLGQDAGGRVRLEVRDDGNGLPPGLDWKKAPSLGLRLVQMLARQLRATVAVAGDAGTAFTITFAGPKP
ncbi:PAS domain S-box protein [Desulfosarcina sp.]|uniref:PAS domain S-box protein n=1 Tax=Desulfosarcina sp. TaxID=2027861 RepID=UPI0039711652